ncbi:lipoamide acyltransferase component of branched-chain alpha-keto acid dehydrogenase complex, mitochondrial-like isoform X2 [Sycon ciliatum]|uniref:lipoamide acyltransferase component of branched-chain alpha-keto acid dehydrogenase complex, mitochondrial-like isoform X2 n=1 Tax=Sycon ciliatum TaxID=27933 RepID=UPI0031F64650
MSLLGLGGRRSAFARGLRCVSCMSRTNCTRKAANAHKHSIVRSPLASHPSIGARYFQTASCRHAKVVKPFILKDLTEGMEEATVTEWFVKPGDVVGRAVPICEVLTDKTSATLKSPMAGVIKATYYEVDQIAKVGARLYDIQVEYDSAVPTEEDLLVAAPAASMPEPTLNTPSSDCEDLGRARVLATPAVRRIARENNVDLGTVPASGKQGRVLKEDIVRFLSEPPETTATPTPPTPPASMPARPLRSSAIVADKVEAIKGIRKAMVKTMTAANAIPTFGFNDEISMDQLVIVREQLKDIATSRGTKLSYMPFFLKAASMAMLEYPILNSSPNSACTELTYKAEHNFGVAMDTPTGLLVPNIKSVQDKSIFEIASELQRLMTVGAAGKLEQNDMSGGTFSLSNIGAIGGTYARPVLLPPEVLIGALGRMQAVPRFDKDDNVVKARILNVSWSADHRVIDGATVARFSNLWKQYLENPATLLADMR